MIGPAVLSLVLAAPPAAGSTATDAARPEALREVGFDQKLGDPVPLDAGFLDESGKPVRLADYFGARPVVLNLVYHGCPMLCPLSMEGFVSALTALSLTPGAEFEVVTLSFDPGETPALAATKKRAWLARYGRDRAERAATGWHFLTGSQESIDRLTRAVGFRYAWDEASRQFAHPTGIVVLTPAGKISRYLFGIEYAPKDLRLALVDSASERIGNPIDQVLLACYRYDPLTGRYSASILAIVRLLGAVTVLALAAFILTMRRRERREAARRRLAAEAAR